MNKILVISLVIFTLLVGVLYSYQISDSTTEDLVIKNPSSGESWDSVEDFRFRNSNKEVESGRPTSDR